MKALLKGIAIAASALVLTGCSARAQDWAGWYGGVHVGYAAGDYLTGAVSGFGPNVSVEAGVGGVTVGRNWQSDNVVYGFEADISSGPDGITPQGTFPASGGTYFCGSGDCNASINTWASLRGRYGWVNGPALMYVTAGIAFADVDGGIENSVFQGGGTTTGVAFGAGYEREIGARSTLRIEYLFVDVGNLPFGFPNTGVAGDYYGAGDFDVVRVGWNMRF